MLIKLLLIALAFAIDAYVLKDNYNICNTEECRNMANLIISSMNKTADPCNDFYNYVCGSWPEKYPVPKGKPFWNHGGNITKSIQASLIEILQEEPNSEDSIPLSVEKKLFKACMDEGADFLTNPLIPKTPFRPKCNLTKFLLCTAVLDIVYPGAPGYPQDVRKRIEQKGLEGLSKIIEGLGGWPMAMSGEKSNKKDISWQKVAIGYLEYSTAIPLFSIGVAPDSQNSSIKHISLQEHRSSLLNKHITDALLKSLETTDNDNEYSAFDILQFFLQLPMFYANYTKNSVDHSTLLFDIFAMIQFTNDLQLIKTPPNEEVNLLGKIMTISDFQKHYNRNKSLRSTSKIDWTEIIRTLMKGTEIFIDDFEEIVIDKSYFDKLFSLLEITSHETIVNYLHWNFLLSNLANLNKEAKKFTVELAKITTGITPTKEDRSEECITQQLLKHGVTNEYLKKHFPKSISVPVKKIAEDIRKEIDDGILNTSWMDRKTKLLAKEKLKAMEVKIGYPEYYDEEKEFNKIYDGLKVSQDHFENVMRILKLMTMESLKKLREPFNRDEWFMTPLTVNAYYFPPGNSLTIPAAQLLIPTCNTNIGLLSANYGSVGFIIGHEMSHGFDMLGYKYDKNGNVIPWWSDKVVTGFKTRANCFIKQYDNYGVNGKLTQSENIADSAGLNAAYSAFIKKANKIRDVKLPNLEDVTQKQLFFLNFANTFCHSTTKYFEKSAEKDVHTKINLRINGAVANVKGFAEAFQCSKNSHLNPAERCIVWE